MSTPEMAKSVVVPAPVEQDTGLQKLLEQSRNLIGASARAWRVAVSVDRFWRCALALWQRPAASLYRHF